LAIDDDLGKVGPEHSKYLQELAGTSDIIGQDFYSLLFKNSAFTQDEKSQIMGVICASVGQEDIGFTMNSHLLPREAVIKNPDSTEGDNNRICKSLDKIAGAGN